MAFLKKDMNLKLVFLILALVVAIAIFSTFYQTKLKDISTEYENKTEALEKITAKAVSEEAKVQEISQISEKVQKDKGAIEKSYTELKNENEALKTDKNNLQEELAKTKSELQDKIDKFNLLQNRFNQVEESLIEANDEISRLAAKIRNLCKQLQESGRSGEGC